jgi:cyanophycin synthetase
MFDEIIIRQDRNLRGRTEEEIISLLMKGIKNVSPQKTIHIYQREKEAIDFAIRNAKKNSFIVICSDVVPDALQQIMTLKEQEDNFEMVKEDIPNVNV